MTELSKFFTGFAERAHKENNLSDITYALCRSNISFCQFFLDFFFPGAGLRARDVEITREYFTEWGRPDFWIRNRVNQELYIVEVKIWDGSHHFEQYFKILKEDSGLEKDSKPAHDLLVWRRLGYIANYPIRHKVTGEYATGKFNGIPVEKLCMVRTWEALSKCLSDYNWFDDEVVEAYDKQYLQSVCPFDNFALENGYQVVLEDFIGIAGSRNAIEEVVRINSDCTFRRSTRSGCVFGYTVNGELKSRKVNNGWFGVRMIKGDNGYRAVLSHEGVDDSLKDDLVSLCKLSSENLNAFLQLKSIPWIIENRIFSLMLGDGYEIHAAEGDSSQETFGVLCGRWFKLQKQNEYTAIGGWIGVRYGDKMYLDSNEEIDLSQKPKFVIAVDDNWTGAEVLKQKYGRCWYHDCKYKKLNYEIADKSADKSVLEIVKKAEAAFKQIVEVAKEKELSGTVS